jgi:hypothetical protein
MRLFRHRGKTGTSTEAQPFTQVINKEHEAILAERQKELNELAPDEFVGLALSGGGIRSATFNLGILQALADIRLLRHIDYLSTVSGGGYIGSWLLARLRQNEEKILDLENSLSPERYPNPGSEQWAPIQFLRDYSNYLTPQPGFLSADTWVTAGIWLRNTLLIQSVLVLALSGLLLIPRLLYFVPIAVNLQPRLAAGVAVGLFTVLLLAAGRGLRGFSTPETMTQNEVLITVVGPLFLLSWYSAIVISYESKQPTTLTLWTMPGLVGLTIFIGLTIVQKIGGIGGVSKVPFALCSGALASILTYAAMVVLFNSPQSTNPWNVNAYGPLFAVAVVSAILTWHIGLLGRNLPDAQREWISRAGAWLNIVALCCFALSFVAVYAPWIVLWLRQSITAALPALTLGWVVSTIGGLISGWSPKSGGSSKPTKGWVKLVATYAPYVFVAGLLCLLSFTIYLVVARITHYQTWSDILSQDAYMAYWRVTTLTMPHYFGVLLLTSIVLFTAAFVLSWRFDLNEFSMHHFYKNRLIRCYLGAARPIRDKRKARAADAFTGFDPKDEISLDQVTRRPYPIINTTLNLVHGERLAWQERKAASFTLSPEYCGFDYKAGLFTPKATLLKNIKKNEPLAGHAYRPTNQYGGGIHLGTAMAISGAAVNPNMGSITSSATAFLMTTFNVRLGWWLGNPRHNGKWNWCSPSSGILYLLAELTGCTNDERAFVNLSDGGHFENLGIYELVRRRCKYIIACDATGDSKFAFEDLGGAIRKCRADFGVEIKLDFGQILPDRETGRSLSHCAIGTIEYPEIGGHEKLQGTLIYIKSSLTGDEPSDVLEYATIHPQFPHDSTADQWFAESQFESYRQLGYHIGGKIFELSKGALQAAERGEKVLLKPVFEGLRDHWHAPSTSVRG